jgi:SPP1 gp7 family putative phage head morphogenesis protein
VIRDAIVDKDVFGLGNLFAVNLQINETNANVPRKAFDFPLDKGKLDAFMEWLQSQEDRGLLTIGYREDLGRAIDNSWQNTYIRDSYKRGVLRGTYELENAGYDNVSSIEKRGGIAAVMSAPPHINRVGLLYSRAFNELRGITDSMNQKISRVLAQGLIEGDNPRLIARKLNKVIKGGGADLGLTDTLGRFIPAERRAEILARTEVIRAHHQGMVQTYRNWGVEGVHVKAEFRTAGDGRVCAECAGLAGTIFSLSEVDNLIPVHPLCRCIALPITLEEIEAK